MKTLRVCILMAFVVNKVCLLWELCKGFLISHLSLIHHLTTTEHWTMKIMVKCNVCWCNIWIRFDTTVFPLLPSIERYLRGNCYCWINKNLCCKIRGAGWFNRGSFGDGRVLRLCISRVCGPGSHCSVVTVSLQSYSRVRQKGMVLSSAHSFSTISRRQKGAQWSSFAAANGSGGLCWDTERTYCVKMWWSLHVCHKF